MCWIVKAIDQSINVSGFSCTPCSSLSLCIQRGAFWVQMCPDVSYAVDYSFKDHVVIKRARFSSSFYHIDALLLWTYFSWKTKLPYSNPAVALVCLVDVYFLY